MTQVNNRASQARDIERGKRELATLRPYFRCEIVESIVRRLFPNQVGDTWQILNDYQGDSGEVSSRIHLDALKLSEGNQDKLKENINAAKRDFREVILPAENPRASGLGFVAYVRLSDEEKDRVTNEDLKEYLNWIENR
jgi:hypothetical protein